MKNNGAVAGFQRTTSNYILLYITVKYLEPPCAIGVRGRVLPHSAISPCRAVGGWVARAFVRPASSSVSQVVPRRPQRRIIAGGARPSTREREGRRASRAFCGLHTASRGARGCLCERVTVTRRLPTEERWRRCTPVAFWGRTALCTRVKPATEWDTPHLGAHLRRRETQCEARACLNFSTATSASSGFFCLSGWYFTASLR